MVADYPEQTVLGKWFGEVSGSASDGTASAIEQSVAGGKQDDRRVAKVLAVTDETAGLITIEAWHQNVAENQRRPTFHDFGQSLETVFGKQHRITGLG